MRFGAGATKRVLVVTGVMGLVLSGLVTAAPAAEVTAVDTARFTPRPRTDAPLDQFALAGGCYVMRSAIGRYLARTAEGFAATADSARAAEPFRFQATDLGRYLIFGTAEDFLAAGDGRTGTLTDSVADSSAGALGSGLTQDGSDTALRELGDGELGTATGRGATVGSAEAPSELADWRIDRSGGAFRVALPALGRELAVGSGGRLALAGPGKGTSFTFALVRGCASWPEVDVNVDGPAVGGSTPYTEVQGYLDAHLHGMAFEFLGGRVHCGRPWHPYGVDYALRGCAEHEPSGGRTHVVENFISGRDPVAGHDPVGWPTFKDWPAHYSLAYEQTYYKWLERAWRGGLRMYTNLLVENHALCDLYPFKRNSCNEMDAVLLQAQRLREFERYIDAQNGGPGRGWLRIVRDPFEARRVINEGKLAVVIGVEVSTIFDCGVRPDRGCSEQQIDSWLDRLHDLGIRQLELVNKFDNALTGVKGDAGSTGVLVNGANAYETGRFWQMSACPDDHAHDHTQPNVHDDAGTPEELTGRDALAGTLLSAIGETGAAPLYGQGPHCNTQGLTDLGAYTIDRVADRGLIFDPDHMSAKAADQALTQLEQRGYSGVISSHSWADEGVYRRVLALGGMVTPMAGTSKGFAKTWADRRGWGDERFYQGLGFGSDINGFAAQGAPSGGGVSYPFTGFGGTTIRKQVSGERTFDINTDGVAHYGLYPDWVEDARLRAGDEFIADLERGPEAYLQMWERAVGIAGDSCRPDVADLTDADLARVTKGMRAERVLRELGQPHLRRHDIFEYCLAGEQTARVRLDRSGRVVGVTRAPQTS